MGQMVVARGELWWGESPDERGRPFLSSAATPRRRDAARPGRARDDADRSVPSELPVGSDEGLPHPSVAAFDNVRPFPKAMLVRRIGALAPGRRHLLCAVAAALDC